MGESRRRRVGGEVYLMLQCHHQNGSCIKMGNGVSLFLLSFLIYFFNIIVKERSHSAHIFWRDRRAESQTLISQNLYLEPCFVSNSLCEPHHWKRKKSRVTNLSVTEPVSWTVVSQQQCVSTGGQQHGMQNPQWRALEDFEIRHEEVLVAMCQCRLVWTA